MAKAKPTTRRVSPRHLGIHCGDSLAVHLRNRLDAGSADRVLAEAEHCDGIPLDRDQTRPAAIVVQRDFPGTKPQADCCSATCCR